MEPEGSQKVCCRCGHPKALSEFSFKDLARRILHGYCRECHAAWNRGHYERNRATYIANAKRHNAWYQAENLRNLITYLIDHPCVDCGEGDVLVLDFDHRDPTLKRIEVSTLMRRATAWAAIEVEIAKCDVRCANCHRRRTAIQGRWRKATVAVELQAGAAGLEPAKPSVLETDALPIELRP